MSLINENNYKDYKDYLEAFKNTNLGKHEATFVNKKELLEMLQNENISHLKIEYGYDQKNNIVPILTGAKMDETQSFEADTSIYLTGTKYCPPSCNGAQSFENLA